MNQILRNIAAATRNINKLELDLENNLEEFQSVIESNKIRPHFIETYHEKPESWTTLIHLSFTDNNAHEKLVWLAQRGFFVHRATKSGTQFVHRDSVHKVWPELLDGTYEMDSSGIVYKYSGPRSGGRAKSLVVVFSSVHANMYTQKLNRYFAQDFPDLEKLVSSQTGVLRVADLDGIVGGFYMPTVRDPKFHSNLKIFLDRFISDLGISLNHTVAFGAAKGGTGALLAALMLKINALAVEPIVEENSVSRPADDRYFTSSEIFTRSKSSVLNAALVEYENDTTEDARSQISIITSEKSEEFSAISNFIKQSKSGRIVMIKNRNSSILKHQDVAKVSVGVMMGIINLYSVGLEIAASDETNIDY